MDGDGDDVRDGEGDDEENRGRELREDGPGERGAGSAFDPTPYVRQLRGRGGAQDYLDVKFRLLWLRREHPDAEIVTEHIRIDEGVAIFKATVVIPGGGKATGHGSETAGDFPDYIEKAETKALGRALNALGYGAQFAEVEDAASDRDAAPVRPSAAAVPAVPPAPRSAETEEQPAPAPAPAPTPMAGRAGATERRGATTTRPTPVDIAAGRERTTTPPPTPFPSSTAGRTASTAGAAEAEPALEDYSWTAFWKWAREQGYDSKGGIEAFIGRPMNNLNPAQVRELILAKRAET